MTAQCRLTSKRTCKLQGIAAIVTQKYVQGACPYLFALIQLLKFETTFSARIVRV